MNANTDFVTALEQALGVLRSWAVPAADLKTAAETVRGVVVDIDAKNELAPQREVEILGGMRGQSIAETSRGA